MAARRTSLVFAMALAGCAVLAQGCGMLFNTRPSYESYDDNAEPPSNAIYAELFGNGLLLTLNYEKIIDGKVFARFGGLCVPANSVPCPLAAPVMVGYLLGMGPNKLELALGQLWIWNTPMRGWTVAQTATVAWRYQPSRSGMMWKVGYTPILGAGPGQNESAPIWLGIASGYTW